MKIKTPAALLMLVLSAPLFAAEGSLGVELKTEVKADVGAVLAFAVEVVRVQAAVPGVGTVPGQAPASLARCYRFT